MKNRQNTSGRSNLMKKFKPCSPASQIPCTQIQTKSSNSQGLVQLQRYWNTCRVGYSNTACVNDIERNFLSLCLCYFEEYFSGKEKQERKIAGVTQQQQPQQ